MGHWHLKHWKLGYNTSTEAVQYQIETQIRTDIRALGLTDVVSASVVVKKTPAANWVKEVDGLLWPLILITPQKPQLPPTLGSNVQDDVIYGVMVTLVDDDNQEKTLEANHNKYLLWLQKIRKQFHNKRLSNVSTVYTCQVEQYQPVLPGAWQDNKWASALLIKVFSRETRG